MGWERIAAVSEVTEGKTLKFQFERGGRTVDAFLARFQGRLVAYENQCRHLALTLDYDDNRFFAADGQHFICQNHGALYDPLTGLCLRGPCEGQRLKPLPIEVVGRMVWLVD